MARGRRKTSEKQASNNTYLDRLSGNVDSSQSKLSMVLGALIILVLGVLIFNYFKAGKESLGPAQQTVKTQEDVSPDKLPGKYTVKEGDTLFTIAEKYYQDGFKFTEIAKANNLTDVNILTADQVLEIPKLAEVAMVQSSPSPSPEPSVSPDTSPSEAPSTTTWGPKIEGNSYTVVEGDWLSTIAARAYGDIYAYKKLAEVNNIPNPDLIFPGQVITIP